MMKKEMEYKKKNTEIEGYGMMHMKNLALFGLLLFVLMVGTASAATSSSPTLQITGYSTTPASIYAGTNGQLQLTMSNGGGATATAITIYYDHGPGSDTDAQTSIGDLGAGSTTMASIPFSVPSDIEGGVMLVHMNIYYKYGDSQGGSSNTGSTTVTVPISVLQHSAVDVNTLSVNGTPVTPGGKFTALLEIRNTGGAVNNAVIRFPDNSSFTLAGASQQKVGDIASGESKTVSVDIVSSSSAAPGKYTIPIIVEYQDPIQNIVSQTISIGPVSVADSSAQFSVTLKPLTPAEVGSQAQFELTVENRGSTPASVIIDLSQSSVFTPLGNSRIYMDAVAPGGSETRTIILGIEPSTSAGYYTLPIGIISDDGNTYTQNMGIAVQATQETTVSSSINPSFVSPGSQNVVVTAQIANTGNTPIRSVYVTVPQSKDFELVGATDKFIGTLNVDDFTTFQFTVNVPGRLSPGKYGIPIQIVFKDSTNTQHTVTKNVDITLSGPNDAAAMGNTGAQGSGNSSFTRRSGNSAGALSFLGPLAGFGIPGLIVLIALIAVVGYFGYKKFVGVKKK